MLVDDMAKALEGLADDLADELVAKYGTHLQYKTEMQRYERDMKPVRAARRLLAIHRGEPTTP
jgi:hypothetical protein